MSIRHRDNDNYLRRHVPCKGKKCLVLHTPFPSVRLETFTLWICLKPVCTHITRMTEMLTVFGCCGFFLTKTFRARAEWVLPNPTTRQMMPRKGSLTNKHGERPRAKKPTSSRDSLLFKASSCVVKVFCEAFSDSTSAFVVCSPLPRSATVWSAHKQVMLLLATGLKQKVISAVTAAWSAA